MNQHSTSVQPHHHNHLPINRRLFPEHDDMDIDDEDVFGGQRNPTSLQPLQPLQPPQPTPPQPIPPQPTPPQPTPPQPIPPQPTPPQPTPLPQLPTPPQHPSVRDPARNIGGRRYPNVWRPSNAGESDNKWCSTGRHHRPLTDFSENGRTFQTCNDCRAAQRCRRANQHAANATAQVLQQLEQQEGLPQNPVLPDDLAPEPPHPPPPPPPVPPPQPLDPLLDPAISPEDHSRLERVRAKWAAIQLQSCDGCEWEWFDLDVQQMGTGENLCKDCRKQKPLFHKNNNLYPGPGCPDLPILTQIEEMLISPVHALIQVGY